MMVHIFHIKGVRVSIDCDNLDQAREQLVTILAGYDIVAPDNARVDYVCHRSEYTETIAKPSKALMAARKLVLNGSPWYMRKLGQKLDIEV